MTSTRRPARYQLRKTSTFEKISQHLVPADIWVLTDLHRDVSWFFLTHTQALAHLNTRLNLRPLRSATNGRIPA